MKSGVANRLRELRQRHGLTQEALARDLDVSRHTILAIEVGRYVPSIELALLLAAYFDEPLETIFWLTPPPAIRAGAIRADAIRADARPDAAAQPLAAPEEEHAHG